MQLVVAVALVIVASCVEPLPDVGAPIVSAVEIHDLYVAPVPRLDLLVVVDSAPTMAGEQQDLRSAARSLVSSLRYVWSPLPDLHVAVIDGDLGTLGVDVGDPRCAGSGNAGRMTTFDCGVDGDFIADERDGWGAPAYYNYAGTLEDKLECVIASVGSNGCPWRQPLEAMRRALVNGRRDGFLRDDALLFVVLVGDGDDCSAADRALYDSADPFACFAHGVICDGADDPYAVGPRTGCRPRDDGALHPVADYAAFLRGLKQDPRDVFVSAVTPFGDVAVEAGPRLASACTRDTRGGTPAVRIQSMLDLLPDRNVSTSLCAPFVDIGIPYLTPWGSALPAIPLSHTCMSGTPIDTDPTQVGLQAAARSWLSADDEVETAVPICSSPALPPCLEFFNDAAICDDQTGIRFGSRYAPRASRLHVEVVVEVTQ